MIGDDAHIVLIGEMASGKTFVGKRLAGLLGRPFRDSDEIIETATGQSGNEIAQAEGVEALHLLELEVFVEAADEKPPAVIAPAASVVDTSEARDALMKQLGIWLDAPPEVLMHRRRQGDHRRPVDNDETMRLRARRRVHFDRCSVIRVDTSLGSPAECASLIADELKARGRL